MLEIIISQVVNGLLVGGLYVLIAIGLSIIFGLLGIVNFAHGAFFTLGAYFTLTLYQIFGWPAVILAPILVGIVGMIAERLLIQHLYDKEPLISLIVTFAMSLLVEATVRLIYGGIGQPFSPPAFLSGFLIWGPILMTTYRMAVLFMTAAVLLGLWLFLEKTPFGRILRAGSRDPEMVGLLGINLPRVLTGVFGLRHRRPAGRADLGHHPGHVAKRDHARLRDRRHRRPGLVCRRSHRRADGGRRDRPDQPVLPAGLRGRDVRLHGPHAAAETPRLAG
jgi:branched-chain amino acid transport system permease protein